MVQNEWVYDIRSGVEGYFPAKEDSRPDGDATVADERKVDEAVRAHEVQVYGRVVSAWLL